MYNKGCKLKHKKGYRGPRGIRGLIGPAGIDGDTGPTGSQGPTGDVGPNPICSTNKYKFTLVYVNFRLYSFDSLNKWG